MTLTSKSASSIIVIMGVSGVGKTTFGTMLASKLGWQFQEGDALHPASNVAKMSAGIPLTDADREPWLDRVKAWIDGQHDRCLGGVITCSALKRRYRDKLAAGRTWVLFVYLEADHDTIRRRLEVRTGHFMPPRMLDSQFADLEPPTSDERAVTVPATAPVDDLVQLLCLETICPQKLIETGSA